MTCVICDGPFEKRAGGRGYKKTTLSQKLAGAAGTFTLEQGLALLGLDIAVPAASGACSSPGSCFTCSALVSRFCAKKTECEQIRTDLMKRATVPPCQAASVKRQRTPAKTPRKVKRANTGTSPAFTPMRQRLAARFSPRKTQQQKKGGFKQKVIQAVEKSNYTTALNTILRHSSSAQVAFRQRMMVLIRREMASYRRANHYPTETTKEALQEFSWSSLIADMEDNMPTFYSACVAAMTTRNSQHLIRGKRRPNLGMMLNLPLYTRHRQRFKFVASIIGIQMWRCGASLKLENGRLEEFWLFASLHSLGISMREHGVRGNIDRLVAEGMGDLTQWVDDMLRPPKPMEKSPPPQVEMSNQGKTAATQPLARALFPQLTTDSEDSDSDDTDWNPDDESTCSEFSDEDVSLSETDEEAPAVPDSSQDAGYSITWDNTQLMVHARHQSSDKKNKMLLWANAFVAGNRVSFRHLDDTTANTVPASLIPLGVLLPDQALYDRMRFRMEVIVGRILCDHLGFFKRHGSPVKHITHAFTEASKKKSRLVNIGVFDADPTSTAGVRDIMEHLHNFVPWCGDEKTGDPHVIACHGDQLSVERMWEAKRTRAFNQSRKERFLGLEPSPQEFHHRGIVMQDTLNMLFCQRSLDQRGTLYQLKMAFEHRNVSGKAMDCYNHLADFLRFVTESFTVLLALKELGLESMDDTPKDAPKSAEDMPAYLRGVCQQLVGQVWHQMSMSQISAVLDAELPGDVWCMCHEESDEQMVECSNLHCPFGRWFHVSCVDIETDEAPTGDWWCSTECRDTNSSAFCTCRQLKGPTISCSNKQCERGQCFHLECVKSTCTEVKGKWYCSLACTPNESNHQEDFVQNYSKAVLFRGLLDATMKDAVREADGQAMMDVWRHNMPEFWNMNHPKYFILGIRLLAGINGWLPERVAQEIMHNRTANLKGGLGHNIALDQVNEFLNNEFKEILKHSRGRYTPQQVDRAGKIAGPVSRELDRIFAQKIGEIKHHIKGSTKQANYKRDIQKMVSGYQGYELFHHSPGRQHEAYPGFTYDCQFKKPDQLKKRMVSHLTEMDRARGAQTRQQQL